MTPSCFLAIASGSVAFYFREHGALTIEAAAKVALLARYVAERALNNGGGAP